MRQQLRDLGEPVTLFGERELERRERLRGLLAALDAQGKGIVTSAVKEEDDDEVAEVPVAELFYTEGTQALLEHRRRLAKDSLQRAAKRIRRGREHKDEISKACENLVARAKEISEDCSEFGDQRPLSDCCASSDGKLLFTASWSGTYKVWQADGCKKQLTVRAHSDRITGIAWHPLSPSGPSCHMSEEDGNGK